MGLLDDNGWDNGMNDLCVRFDRVGQGEPTLRAGLPSAHSFRNEADLEHRGHDQD